MRAHSVSPGKVYLVGAGPGAPDLLTLRAARVLAAADVVLVDALVDRGVLAHCRAHARVIDVGKRGGCRSTPQAFIERLLLRYARQGHVVVRLKGGDPFVFGRGGEEYAFLRGRGIDVEVVPGLTAGIAVPAALGIPVTQRGIALAVAFVSGHASGEREPDWRALVQSGATLVIYMGLRRLECIVRKLIAAGLDLATPVAVIARGTLPDAHWVRAPLADIAAAVAARALAAPALIVVGDVVALAAQAAAPSYGDDGADLFTALEAIGS